MSEVGAGVDSKDACLYGAASNLASDVVESFNATRQYLREVSQCLERVDPHLGNNSGLVSRLVDWEESWEIGRAYLSERGMLLALCDTVSEMQRTQAIAPKLADMCEECDVSLFMVLPRLVWLRFLIEPTPQIPVLARLLPNRFKAAGGALPSPVAELEAFASKYSQLEMWLESMLETPEVVDITGTSLFVRALLAKHIVNEGVDGPQGSYAGVQPSCIAEAKNQVDSFMLELEGWSIELQRHCPEDWNQYSAVLIQCLRNEAEKERKGPFGV
jgi:hypothetical protein